MSIKQVTVFGGSGFVGRAIVREELDSIINARVEEIFELLRDRIDKNGGLKGIGFGVVLTGGTSQLPGIRKVASNVLNLPCRVAAPQGLQGLVDKLSGPAYSTSVGLLHWANRESQVASRTTGNKKKRGRTINIEKGLDFFKRLLP